MTAVHLSCPLCSGILEVDSSAAGLQLACPACQGIITVPDLDRPDDHAPPPPHDPAGDSIATHPEVVAELGCPHCTGNFQVTREMERQQVACPHCQGIVTVPWLTQAGIEPANSPPALESPPAATSPPPAARHAEEVPDLPPPALQPNPDVPNLPPLAPHATPSQPSFRSSMQSPPAVTIPTPDGGHVAVREPIKTVGKPGEEIELRCLTNEERQHRRFTRNILMIVVGVMALLIAFMVLKQL